MGMFRVRCPFCYLYVDVNTNKVCKDGLNVREVECPSCEKIFSVVLLVESVKDVTHSDEEISIAKSKLRRLKLKRVRDLRRLESKLDGD